MDLLIDSWLLCTILILAPSDTSSVADGGKVHRMVAIFDYDPWESSPNLDIEVINKYYTKYIFLHICAPNINSTAICVCVVPVNPTLWGQNIPTAYFLVPTAYKYEIEI